MITGSPAPAAFRYVPGALIVVGVVAAGAAVFGVRATAIVVGVPLAAAAAWYAIQRPAVMVSAMVAIEMTNLAGVVAEQVDLPVFHASLGLGMVTVALALCDQEMRNRLNKGTAVCAGLVAVYLVTEVLSALGSQDGAASIAVLKSSLIDCVFLMVVLLLVQMTESWWPVAAAVVVPLAVISVLTVISQIWFQGSVSFGGFATVTAAGGELVTTQRFGGPLPDSNFWGRHLVLGLPMAAALCIRAGRAGAWRPLTGWSAALLALLAGVYLTQSRGSMIAAGVALLVWVLASGPTVRRRGLMAVPFLALIAFLPGIGNRLVALAGDVLGAGSNYVVDPSVLGRIAAQEVAWAMFWDRPVFGFGPGLYPLETRNYAGIVDTAVLEPTDAAHNLYAQAAAETGIVGLIGWIVLVVGFAACVGIRAVGVAAPSRRTDQALAAAVLASIVGWSVASVFLHLAYFRTFAVVLAVAGALGSARGARAGPAVQARSSLIRATAGASIVGVAVAGLVLAVAPTHSYATAGQRITIVPTPQMKDYYGYAFDIRTRAAVLPTYAAMIARGDHSMSAVADRVRGVIKVSVTRPDPQAARADLDAALIRARTNLADLRANSWYTLNPVGGVVESSGDIRPTAWTAGAAIAGALAAVVALLVMRCSTRIPRNWRAFGNDRQAAATGESVDH
ncbi:O-antigen ligase family protein [Mycobacterium sp. 134]|uniref:O-antigen ligase family protein n=1 Tax=Mycobacterium sp. 134 TaxID=3400425 RepID=UPI003AB02D56